MPDRRGSQGGGGNRVSPQTLVVASLASLTAAIVTSTFWRGGTPITAAITPVIVALASELYGRPARRITELSSRAATRTRRLDPVEEVARERAAMGGSTWRPNDGDDRPPPIREPEPGSAPVRVYKTSGGGGGAGGGRRFNPKVALVTAAIAFAIAAFVLTVPELVFGGSVASHGQTTLFGGSSHKQKSSSDKKQTPTSSTPSQTTTTPTATTPTQTQQAPAQTAPQTTTPAPSGGAAPAPGGTVAPQSQTTPAPTP
jgi:hypothetical protein